MPESCEYGENIWHRKMNRDTVLKQYKGHEHGFFSGTNWHVLLELIKP